MSKVIEKIRSSIIPVIFSITKFVIIFLIIAQFICFLENYWKQIQPLYKKENLYPYLTKDNDIIITTISIAHEIGLIDNKLKNVPIRLTQEHTSSWPGLGENQDGSSYLIHLCGIGDHRLASLLLESLEPNA